MLSKEHREIVRMSIEDGTYPNAKSAMQDAQRFLVAAIDGHKKPEHNSLIIDQEYVALRFRSDKFIVTNFVTRSLHSCGGVSETTALMGIHEECSEDEYHAACAASCNESRSAAPVPTPTLETVDQFEARCTATLEVIRNMRTGLRLMAKTQSDDVAQLVGEYAEELKGRGIDPSSVIV